MNPSLPENWFKNRIAHIEERVQNACARRGRSPAEVTIIAVTKYVSNEIAADLVHAGMMELGESRPQELWRKAEDLPDFIHWHLVGHLQTNKIERTLPLVSWIHSVDSLRLLQALEKEAVKQNRLVNILLEVNASGEVQKHGFQVQEMDQVIATLAHLHQVRVGGLMTMAALEGDSESCRKTFAQLRQLRDRLQENVKPPHHLVHLSMGMTGDFEIAIEEGATMIRIGSLFFEGLENFQ